MPKLIWDDRFLIGIPQCDEQHQRLVSLLNRAYDAFVDNNDDQDVAWLLNELVDYATYHFISEEQRMVASNFPHYEMHKSAHDTFSNQVTIMYKNYRNGDTPLLSDIFSFLNLITIELQPVSKGAEGQVESAGQHKRACQSWRAFETGG